MSSAAVVRARFPRATGNFNRYAGAVGRGLDEAGRMAWFAVSMIGQTGHALRCYPLETLRQIAQTGLGAGVMALVGGAVEIGRAHV